MELRGLLLMLAAVWGIWPLPVRAQPANASGSWRVFAQRDGLAASDCFTVTPGPNGEVLLRHLTTNAVTVFDGYDFVTLPGPPGERRRVFKSPSGQLWTVATEGLREFRDGEWPLVPVGAIAAQFSSGQTNEIQLLPVRQGRVLILLPDELLQLTVTPDGHTSTETLLRANDASLGRLTNMLTARDGGLLLEGTRGIARSPQPYRNLIAGTRWDRLLQLPVEFEAREFPPADFLRAAQIHDRLVNEQSGVWLATAIGLAHFAAPLWEVDDQQVPPKPPPVELTGKDRAVVTAAAELGQWSVVFKSRNGDVWLGATSQVARVHGDTFDVFSSTNQIGPEQVSAFAESPEGRIVCATPAKLWEFDGRTWLLLRGGFNQINDLLYDRNGTLWVASNGGLYRLMRAAWVRNGLPEGLPADAVIAIQENQSGDIIATTASGAVRLNPLADGDPPRALIHPLPGGHVREGAAVRVVFAGRDRWDVTTPARLLYSYKLDEREWSPFEETTEAVFPEVPIGRHLFLVRAMDRNANVSLQPGRLEFNVVRPWYRETRLVYVLATALLVALFFAGLALNRHRRLQLSYADVERQVAERTRELALAQRELVHSQKMNALGTLAAGIAHDFNNILSIIKGSAQIIEDNPDHPEKIRTRVDRIKTVVQQGAGIVEAMLGFSRQSAGNVAPADVNQIVDDTLTLLGDRFLRGLEVRFDRAAHLPPLPIVRDFVQQALLNFIFNAAEAMERRNPSPGLSATLSSPDGERDGVRGSSSVHPRNQIHLRTTLTPSLPPGLFLKPAAAGSYIQVSVRDTGEGIPPENLPRIFEPFFTTKAMSSQRGTGLGLSMVYELARKLEAGLAVESEPGLGSTFTLILPVRN